MDLYLAMREMSTGTRLGELDHRLLLIDLNG